MCLDLISTIQEIMLAFYSLIDKESDRQKFEQIYQKYKNLIFYIANLRLNDQYLAEDVTQDTLLRIAQNLQMFADIYSAKTKNLIVRIAIGKTIDLIRKRNKYNTVDDEILQFLQSKENVSELPLENIITNENYLELIEIIKVLNDTDKTILQLKYIYEYSDKEISGLLGVSYKAVGNRLYRAKKNLQKLLYARGIISES
ncbi:RNA polymerase sigma factor [Anaerostipes caccae]|uniref:RNA polymerase sigma factor n=1 Tax=Anaerostipes caccae TaxID=105841 RepID=UPI00101C7A97|nr:sigma-70 family RNA polymerase sigma factor [Anaerostipes caccae]